MWRRLALLVACVLAPFVAQAQTLGTVTVTAADAGCLATNCVSVSLANVAGFGIDVTGTGTYTLQFEVSANGGSTWRSLGAVNQASYVNQTNATAAGLWLAANHGYTHARVRASALSAGTPTVTLTRGTGGVTAPLSAGSVTVGAQPANDPHFVRCSDGAAANPCVVSGTVTANLGAVDNAVLDTIDTSTAAVAGAVAMSGTDLNVICTSGCAGGTSDVDDGSVAGGQTTGIQITLGHLWTGAAWARIPGDATNGVVVDLGGNNDVTVTSGTITSITNAVTVTDGAGALNVICDSGCSGGTSDTDDGSIAGGQTTGITLPLTHYWTGSAWARWTGAVNVSQWAGATPAATNPVPVQISNGTEFVAVGLGTTSTTTGVASSGTSVTLKAANAARLALKIHNNSTASLYVREAATASIASGGYTWKVPPDGTLVIADYSGVVDGIWDAANGYANVTEVE